MIEQQARAARGARHVLAPGEIELPTLVIHGTEDQMIPVSNGHMIAQLIPGARLEILDGVGHMFFLERPERSAELLRAHVAVHA